MTRVVDSKTDYAALARAIKAWGAALGFQQIGIADCELGEAEARLLDWVEALTRLPAGSTAGNVVQMLRDQSADESERLERELASDAAALADLSTAEAASELVAATEQLRDRHLRRQIDALVTAGIHSDEDRARYHSLMAMRRRP